MDAIADSSSLIVLARLDALWLFARACHSLALTTAVENETVVQGKAHGYADATRIESAISTSQFRVIVPTFAENRLATEWQRHSSTLSHADCLTLACAHERRLTLIMEDQRARNVALARKIPYVSIQVLPLQGYIKGQVSFDECNALLGGIGEAMRIDGSILAVLRSAADEIRRSHSK
jgi:predicted nucleic acid-binding protein